MAPGASDREMHNTWNDVAQAQQIERTLVRDHCAVLPHGKPGDEHLFPRGRRVFSEAIKTPPHPDKLAALHVMREQCSTEPKGPGLASLEIATLL